MQRQTAYAGLRHKQMKLFWCSLRLRCTLCLMPTAQLHGTASEVVSRRFAVSIRKVCCVLQYLSESSLMQQISLARTVCFVCQDCELHIYTCRGTARISRRWASSAAGLASRGHRCSLRLCLQVCQSLQLARLSLASCSLHGSWRRPWLASPETFTSIIRRRLLSLPRLSWTPCQK